MNSDWIQRKEPLHSLQEMLKSLGGKKKGKKPLVLLTPETFIYRSCIFSFLNVDFLINAPILPQKIINSNTFWTVSVPLNSKTRKTKESSHLGKYCVRISITGLSSIPVYIHSLEHGDYTECSQLTELTENMPIDWKHGYRFPH